MICWADGVCCGLLHWFVGCLRWCLFCLCFDCVDVGGLMLLFWVDCLLMFVLFGWGNCSWTCGCAGIWFTYVYG